MMRQDYSKKELKYFTAERWKHLMGRFGFSSALETFEALDRAYGEKHRAYHTHEHIEACLRHLEDVKDQAVHPDEIELALWFHDAIYKPFSGTNEEDSADWTKDFLKSQNATAKLSTRVFDMIILTKEHALPETVDAKLILDIDLSILGAKPNIYDQFEKDVRFEYRRVPNFIFKKKRRIILQSFLERPKLYQIRYFYETLENQARQNLANAIARLS